jgi:hypothetical protein
MTPRQYAAEAENAYDARDRPALYRALTLLVALASPPEVSRLTREQLLERRSELHTSLAAVNGQLMRLASAGQLTAHLPQPTATLDPSD